MYITKKILQGVMILLFVISSFVLQAQVYRNNAFKEGETLNYTGYYNLGMIWVKAGLVKMSTGKVEKNGDSLYNIKAIAHSIPKWDWFFRLRDTLEVNCDTLDLNPCNFRRIVHERHLHADINYDFDYRRGVVKSHIKVGDKAPYKSQKLLFYNTHDMLSFAWYARTLDYSRYKEGQKIPVRLIISNKIYNLYIRYLGIDVVETRDGTEVECHKFSPLLVKGSIFKGGEDMTVWVSNDKNRVPIMAEAKIIIGSVKGVLSSYSGLRHKTEIFPSSNGQMVEK